MTDLCLVLSTSYSVPAIIALPIDSGALAYVEWVRETAAPGGGDGSQ